MRVASLLTQPLQGRHSPVDDVENVLVFTRLRRPAGPATRSRRWWRFRLAAKRAYQSEEVLSKPFARREPHARNAALVAWRKGSENVGGQQSLHERRFAGLDK